MSLGQKTVNGVEIHRLSGKEKIPGLVVSKEGYANNVLGDERSITIDFLKKGATVNGASYS